MHIYKCRFNY